MVLLDVLHRLAQRQDWKLVVGHFNHQLRGAESDADEQLVKQTAKRLGLRCVVARGDVKGVARKMKISVEMAARELRHAFFARAAARRGIPTLALAHQADDQVELCFLRLLRGAGGEGLGGMKWLGPAPVAQHLKLIRPLLDRRKVELLAHAQAQGLAFREDASNASLDHLRNRVRHELLPLINEQFGPASAPTILRAMEIIGAEAELGAETARRWLASRRRVRFERLPVAVQRQCLRQQLRQLGVASEFELVERLRESAGQPVTTAPGCVVCRNADGLVRRQRSSTPQFNVTELAVELNPAGGTATFAGASFSWAFEPVARGEARPRAAPGCEYLDAELVGARVRLRHWRAGDRFRPFGMTQAVKLQDAFVNVKIPREQRHRLVVAATADDRIFWVEGLRISEQFKLDKSTTRRLKWRWQRGRPE